MALDGGVPTRFATLPGRSLESIACDRDGRIFVADISAMFDLLALREPRLPPAVLMLDAHGKQLAALTLPDAGVQLTGFNGLIELPGRGLYATDMLAGLIVRFREVDSGKFEASIVARQVAGANGLAYDHARSLLYLAQTGLFGAADQVAELDMRADGTLGSPRVMWTRSQLDGVDGLALDEHGSLYRANQLAGTVTRMPDETIVARVPNPASLAFRGGTLFITDFKMLGPLQNGGQGGVYAVDLGVCRGAAPP
jgi:sugar lactone lactonase YvrE